MLRWTPSYLILGGWVCAMNNSERITWIWNPVPPTPLYFVDRLRQPKFAASDWYPSALLNLFLTSFLRYISFASSNRGQIWWAKPSKLVQKQTNKKSLSKVTYEIDLLHMLGTRCLLVNVLNLYTSLAALYLFFNHWSISCFKKVKFLSQI